MSRRTAPCSACGRLLAATLLACQCALVSNVGCRAVLGLDSDEPMPSRDVDGGVDARDDTPDASDGGARCEPSCIGRACGKDPVCGASCGECSINQACEESDSGAKCSAATLIWEVDGTEIVRFASFEIFTYQTWTTIFFPWQGRSLSLSVPMDATAGTYTSCPESDPNKYVSLSTSDGPHAGLSALPARWKNLVFVKCGQAASGDTVIAADVTLTFAGPTRIAGTWEVVVQGAGPRSGSTLRAHGAFDLTPPPP